MSKRNIRRVRVAASVAVMATGFGLVAPAIASADPLFGSSTGSSVIDDPVGTLIAGSSSIAADPLGALNAGLGLLESVVGPLGLGSSGPVTTQNCNESTQAGGEGVTETNHQLGRSGPTSFVLDYETRNIPDDIEVFYQGARIYDTGYVGDQTNEGTGSVVVSVPPGVASTVLVRVTGPGGTEWGYTVHC